MAIPVKRIALIAHDEEKANLLDWVITNIALLRPHRYWATGTTGRIIQQSCPDLQITRLKSGPLGGDQEVGALIAGGRIDILFFFIDALSPHPHDVDVKALTRLSTLYNVPMANNRSTADFIVTSPCFSGDYAPRPPDLAGYFRRLAAQGDRDGKG